MKGGTDSRMIGGGRAKRAALLVAALLAAALLASGAPAAAVEAATGADLGAAGVEQAHAATTKSIKKATVKLSATSFTYNGSAKRPTVTVKYGSKTLKKGTDYTVTYSNNTNAGTAKVTITGKGGYSGSVTKSFTINKRSVSSLNVSLSSTSFTYNGSAKKPTVTVKNGSGKTISSSNYTVSYSNNTDAGTATVTVKGKGNLKGSVTKSFTINKRSVSSLNVSLSKTSYVYDGSAKKPTVTVKNGSGKTISSSNYTVSYSNNTDAGTATVTVKGKGNLKGSTTATFTIGPAAPTDVQQIEEDDMTGAIGLQWRCSTQGLESGDVTSWQVCYRVKGSAGWKYATVTATMDPLYTGEDIDIVTMMFYFGDPDETYLFKVRQRVSGTGGYVYGAWSDVVEAVCGSECVVSDMTGYWDGGEYCLEWAGSVTEVYYDLNWRYVGETEWRDQTLIGGSYEWAYKSDDGLNRVWLSMSTSCGAAIEFRVRPYYDDWYGDDGLTYGEWSDVATLVVNDSEHEWVPVYKHTIRYIDLAYVKYSYKSCYSYSDSEDSDDVQEFCAYWEQYFTEYDDGVTYYASIAPSRYVYDGYYGCELDHYECSICGDEADVDEVEADEAA